MKTIHFLCLAVIAISLGATGISIAFMPFNTSWKANNLINEFVTRHADCPTVTACLFSKKVRFGVINPEKTAFTIATEGVKGPSEAIKSLFTVLSELDHPIRAV